MTSGTADPAELLGRTEARTGAIEIPCRMLDLAGSILCLVVLAPLMAVIALAIRLESPGAAIFRQRRIGRDQRPFTVTKFRTMRTGASNEVHRQFVLGLISGELPAGDDGRPLFKLASDRRVTRVGRILRRTSLDELPQLWNVLRGEMSLVGPRPPIPYEVEKYPAHWFGRFAVKPGVTGLWQVSGRSQLSLEQMIALDLEYISRRSVAFNVWVLIRTIPAVLSMRGAK